MLIATAAIGGVIGGGVSAAGYILTHPGGNPGDYLNSSCFWKAVGIGFVAGALAGLIPGIAAGAGLIGGGLGGALAGGLLGGAVSGVVAESLGQLWDYGRIVSPRNVVVAGIVGGLVGAAFAGLAYGAVRGAEALAVRRLAAQDVAYRYVGASEAAVIESSRTIPSVDRLGFPRQVFTTTDLYATAQEAEAGLQMGRINPIGATSPPTHRVTYYRNAVRYSYAGNVEGGTGIEMITDQPIPIIRIDRLQGGK